MRTYILINQQQLQRVRSERAVALIGERRQCSPEVTSTAPAGASSLSGGSILGNTLIRVLLIVLFLSNSLNHQILYKE